MIEEIIIQLICGLIVFICGLKLEYIPLCLFDKIISKVVILIGLAMIALGLTDMIILLGGK